MDKRLKVLIIFLMMFVLYPVYISLGRFTNKKAILRPSSDAVDSIINIDTKPSKTIRSSEPKNQFSFGLSLLKPNTTLGEVQRKNYRTGSSTKKKEYRMKADVNKTSVGSASCKPVQAQLSSKPLPITGLVSFPGSGNTWTRHLLEQVSGIATASVYCNKHLKMHDFPFECERQIERVIAVKSHKQDNRSLQMFDRVILIIRNPFHAILSYFNWRVTSNQTGHANKSYFRENKGWRNHVYWTINRWQRMNRVWLLNFTRPIYPLLYENLLSNLYKELHNIFNFLELSVTEDVIMCAIENGEGNYHRKKQKTDNGTDVLKLRELYTDDMVERISHAIEEIKRTLKKAYHIDWKYTALPEN